MKKNKNYVYINDYKLDIDNIYNILELLTVQGSKDKIKSGVYEVEGLPFLVDAKGNIILISKEARK